MNEWKDTILEELCFFQRGHDLPKTKMIDGPYLVAGSNGSIGTHNAYTTEGPSITIGRSGNIGTPHYYKNNFWAHNTVLYVKTFNNNHPKFAYYFLKNIDFSHYNAGSAVPTLNRNHIHKESILLPPLPQQKSIAEVLSSLDDKIDLLHQQNKTLEALAETLFRQWFVEEAEDTELGKEFNVTMGQSPPGHTYNEEKKGMIFYQGRTDFGFRFPTPRVYCTQPTRLANPFDTLISVRAPVGDLNYANEISCIGRGLAAIRHKNKNLHHAYTYYTLKTLKDQFDLHEDSGTIFGSISKNELLDLKCIKFPENSVKKFNNNIGELDDKIAMNCNQIHQLETLRNNLLPKLMSGAVTVSSQ